MMKFLKRLFASKPSSVRQVDRGERPKEWINWKPKDGPPIAPHGFVKLNGATDVAVAGTSYRLQDCLLFLSALKGGRARAGSVKLVREVDNPDFPEAIAVFGILEHKEVHIGYLPKDVTDLIQTKFSDEMPLSAGLKEWGKKSSGEAVFFA